jgi:hypothetical protein
MHISEFVNGISLMQAWKKCRSNLTADRSDQQHLQSVIEFWTKCPLSTRILDWDRPETWLDPWSFIHNNKFDESAISLGMFYTLLLAQDKRWTAERLQLILAKDDARQFQGIILEIDKQWWLNLEYNTITTNKDFFVQQRYTYQNNIHYLSTPRHITDCATVKTHDNATV